MTTTARSSSQVLEVPGGHIIEWNENGTPSYQGRDGLVVREKRNALPFASRGLPLAIIDGHYRNQGGNF